MGILDKITGKKNKEKKPATKGAITIDKKTADTTGEKEKKQEKKKVITRQETIVAPDGTVRTVTKKDDGKNKSKSSKPKKEDTGNAYRILLRPLVTEKSSALGINNQYVFEVSPRANKIEIRKAIKMVYGVTARSINILNVRGRYVRYGRADGFTKQWKKAIITLPRGQKIDIQEGL